MCLLREEYCSLPGTKETCDNSCNPGADRAGATSQRTGICIRGGVRMDFKKKPKKQRKTAGMMRLMWLRNKFYKSFFYWNACDTPVYTYTRLKCSPQRSTGEWTAHLQWSHKSTVIHWQLLLYLHYVDLGTEVEYSRQNTIWSFITAITHGASFHQNLVL